MFKCVECEGTEFQLMLQPGFQGEVEVRHNEHEEVLISANGREFIADLAFMNQFAVCQDCGAIKCWQYHFPNQRKAL